MACPEIVIDAVDAALYVKLLDEATAAGAKFDGTKVELQGLAFDWNYDAEASILHVTCTKKPFYASCQAVEENIRELVAKARTAI